MFQYNTMKLHSVADCVYFPESCEELFSLIHDMRKERKPYYVFSGGSNILFVICRSTALVVLSIYFQFLRASGELYI